MKRAGFLFDGVCTFSNLQKAALMAARGKRKNAAPNDFLLNLEKEIIDLEDELVTERWEPKPYSVFRIHDPKERTICAADFRDRVVHHAVCAVLEPVLESTYIDDTYACRIGKGTHAAIGRAQNYSRRHIFFLKLDVRKFFDSIDHSVLKGLLRRKIKDHKLLRLLDRIIDHPVPWTEPGKGIPIGNLTSQHFANYYLAGLDHYIRRELRIPGYVRYMDDFLLLADEKGTLWDALDRVETYLKDRLHLNVKSGATLLAPIGQGIPFLGFRIFPGTIRIQRKGWRRFRRKLRAREMAWRAGLLDETGLSDAAASLVCHTKAGQTRNLRRWFCAESPLPKRHEKIFFAERMMS